MIRVEDTSDRVRTIVMDRPDKRNAMTPEMITAMTEAVRDSSARVLIIRGEGKVFSAGFDLRTCAADDASQPTLRALLIELDRLCSAVKSYPGPVIAAAHGAALAGAAALVAATDFVAADRAAKFGYPVVRVGISPAVSAPNLAPKVGLGSARTRLLDTKLISGEEAHRLGLVSHLVDEPDAVLTEAVRLAEDIAAKPEPGIVATKRLLNELESLGAGAKGLDTSLSLLGTEESRRMLEAVWKKS